MIKKSTSFLLICFLCLLLFAGCLNNNGNIDENPMKLDMFEFKDDDFYNPGSAYRPLWNLYSIDNSMLDHIQSLGFGGVTTNVPWNDYFTNEQQFEKLRTSVQYAKSKGLRIWLFDERGWPSGKANGMVLDREKSSESSGLVCLYKQSSGGASVSFTMPAGHNNVVNAYAIDKTSGETINLTGSIKSDKSLTFTPSDSRGYDVYYIVTKPFYEGTHATENWVSKIRYPDFLDSANTEIFLNTTHDKYYQYLSEFFGNTVEAFFTEEPQLLGYYMGQPPISPAEIDPVNPNMPLYPTLNYTADFLSEFKDRNGYDIKDKMHLLFGGESEEALKTRWDFHQTISDLYYENFNSIYSDWCKDKNIAYSGHFLFEEYSVHHAMFFGNILKQLSSMQIPGVDMLSTLPGTILSYAKTSLKYGQSAAYLSGKKDLMAELSSSIDNITFGIDEMKANAALHAVYGYNKITSFYNHRTISEDVTRAFNLYSGRLTYLTRGGNQVANAAVFYPAESIFASTLPSAQRYMGYKESISYSEEANKVENSISMVTGALSENQIDYNFIDSGFLKECRVENGKLITKSGKEFKALILPYINAISSETLTLLNNFRQAGLKVIVYGDSEPFAKNAAAFNGLKGESYLTRAELLAKAESWGLRSVKVTAANNALRYMHKEYENADNFLLVNADSKNYISEITFMVKGGKKVKVFDFDKGTCEEVSYNTDGSGNVKLNINIPKYRALLVSVEK